MRSWELPSPYENGKGALPIIAVEGNPAVAFRGPDPNNPNNPDDLDDTPMCIGVAGLTDPVVDGNFGVGQNIVVTFNPPVTQVRLFVIDIDNDENFTLTAFDDKDEVASQTRSAGDPGTGDGVPTEFLLSGESITSVILEINSPDPAGFAIDYLTFTRPCTGSGYNSLFEILQESEPDLGDFDNHFLGVLLAHPTQASAAEVYAYGCPKRDSWNGSLLNPVSDRSHLLLAETTDGLTLFIVHDRPDEQQDLDGGQAEMKFELSGDLDGAFISVEDGPSDGENDDVYTSELEGTLFTSVHEWFECCTDGLALSGLDGDWSVLLQFTDVDGDDNTLPIAGLTQWFAYSADGSQIPLELELGRRVLLRPLTDCNGNGIADALDIENCPEGDPSCQDCNGNSIPDECDLAECPSGPTVCEPEDPACRDCNGNGILDECDIAACPDVCDPSCSDCNSNGVPDQCDLDDECSVDVDPESGIPDECEDCPADFNDDGLVVAFDLAILLGNWGPCESGNCAPDLDLDCHIGPSDLAILLGSWGLCE